MVSRVRLVQCTDSFVHASRLVDTITALVSCMLSGRCAVEGDMLRCRTCINLHTPAYTSYYKAGSRTKIYRVSTSILNRSPSVTLSFSDKYCDVRVIAWGLVMTYL